MMQGEYAGFPVHVPCTRRGIKCNPFVHKDEERGGSCPDEINVQLNADREMLRLSGYM